MDPDKNLIYTRRKARQEQLAQSDAMPEESTVKFPSAGWSTSLQRMPLFTRAEMDLHISKSGKNFDRNKQNHAVPTSMKKAKTFLDDEYLRDLTCASDDQYFYFKCLCYHSFKKIEPPHKLQVALCLVSGVVKYASCTCVAGSVGFCNHVLAVMMKLCKFSLYCCQDIKDLENESDMTQAKACTSSLQLWHRPVRGDKIKPQPVMELEVKKSIYRKQNLENVQVAHMQVTSYSSQSLIFKFSVILTQCLEWTVMMNKMLFLYILHSLCNNLSSMKSQMI